MDNRNKSICITGASRGLGRALCAVFLKDSDFTVYAITRNPESLKGLEEVYASRLVVITADICSSEGRNLVFSSIATRLDILIHNAGKLVFKEFQSITEEELKSVYNVNVFAPFLLTQKLLPLLKESHIISISSIGGVEGSLKFAGLSAYSSSKAALNCLTEMLNEEFKESDNSFNCLALGSVGTEMFESAFGGIEASSTPEEMARYIFRFAQNAPNVMRGKIISVSRSNP